MPLSRFSPTSPPKSVCLLRLSALGDVTHALPVLRTLQTHWPDTRITWVIGKSEYQLVKAIAGVEFIIFDKSAGYSAYTALRRQLKQRRFDILLHMQLSIRASIASLFIPADTRLGFDRERAKDMQWLFSNAKISPASTRQHVVDSFLEFPRHFGLQPVMRWELPVSTAASEQLRQRIASDNSDGQPLLVINPCALAKSRNWRDWTIEGYAAVADYAAAELGMCVALSGGPGDRERSVAAAIVERCQHQPLNLVGHTSLDELVALLDLAEVVIAPDTGPAHIASSLGTPVIGLYAATNPDRARPYRYPQYVVSRYPQALQQYYDLDVSQAPWGKRIQNAECMAMISVDEVTAMLNSVIEDISLTRA